jgi:hypothetical protein
LPLKKDINKLLRDYSEREKELACINHVIQVFNSQKELPELLQEAANALPPGWQYPEATLARIVYNGNMYESPDFQETEYLLKQDFATINNQQGSVEVFYTKNFPDADEGPFLKEERNLINNVAFIIANAITRFHSQHLFYEHTERIKELRGLTETAHILRETKEIDDALKEICAVLPDAWQYPEYTAVRITHDEKRFMSTNFVETPWVMKQRFQTKPGSFGIIEVYYLKEFPELDEGPFMKEERHLINNIAGLIAGKATHVDFQKLLLEKTERVKELDGLNVTSMIIGKGLSMEDTLSKICSYLPQAWQYPENTAARITYGEKVYKTKNFVQSKWKQKKDFVTIDNAKGTIEIFYLKKFPDADEGPFLKEERFLLNNITTLLTGYLNSVVGKEYYYKKPDTQVELRKPYAEVLEKKNLPLPPLQEFFDKKAVEKYVYLDMMRYKVKDILFVARLYDAFLLENEGDIFEQFMGQIYQYSLFSLPRITAVSSEAEALELVGKTNFDCVILMQGIDKQEVLQLSRKIKSIHPKMFIYLLVNKKADFQAEEKNEIILSGINKVFVWTGDSRVFFAIVKYTEDLVNAESDTQIGLVRVILLIEDNPAYYSLYLTYLYSIVFEQVLHTISHVKNEPDKMSKIRSRPKILLATNYEEAMFFFNKYKDFLLCAISDVEFEKDGTFHKDAGFLFSKSVRSRMKTLPLLLQSSDPVHLEKAKSMGISSLNKFSETLQHDLNEFITYHLGFGNFVFRSQDDTVVAEAQNVIEFIKYLKEVPEETILLHALRNEFSLWLMARGEIAIARIIKPVQVYHFEGVNDFRDYIVDVIIRNLKEKNKGKVLLFEDRYVADQNNILMLSPGSLGGKGRGLAFLNTLIANLNFSEYTDDINIITPGTCIVGTDEFEAFIEDNKLEDHIANEKDYKQLKASFFHAELSPVLIEKLRVLLEELTVPLAVRSSSLSEDSLTQPFSGIFDTFILPNNHADMNVRLEHLCQAIKLIYCSVFSADARNYFKAVNQKIEDERMAIVIQALVGKQFDQYFYPHISGIAQSYNYYPIAHMKADEGFASLALGLGEYIVKGDKSFRFSPVYPELDIRAVEDIVRNSQVKFYAVDMSGKEIDILKDGEYAGLRELYIDEAEKHGNLKHLASVYDADGDRIIDGIDRPGPRIINFANVIKNDYIPLPKILDAVLKTIRQAYGAPFEIEFAIDLTKDKENKATFYLLQIKPLVGKQTVLDIDFSQFKKKDTILYSSKSVGNGEEVDLQDIIYVDPDTFDKMKTVEMVTEIEALNSKMAEQNRNYVLIGPGRWGSRDRFLGIPVNWSQISHARVVVEMSLDNFPLDASFGSHFFHNITSMGVGYLSVNSSESKDYIDWKYIKSQKIIAKTEYFTHVRLAEHMQIIMNGKKGETLIRKD